MLSDRREARDYRCRWVPIWALRCAPVAVGASVVLILAAYSALAPVGSPGVDGSGVVAAQVRATSTPRAAPATATPVPQAAADIPTADRRLRQEVSTAMVEAGRRAGVAIDSAGLVYASRDDVTIANAAIAGAQDLSLADLERGADLTFTYLSSRMPGRIIAPGFYTVRVQGAPDGRATALLRNAAGAVIAEMPAVITPAEDGNSEGMTRIDCSVSVWVTKDSSGWDIHCSWGAVLISPSSFSS